MLICSVLDRASGCVQGHGLREGKHRLRLAWDEIAASTQECIRHPNGRVDHAHLGRHAHLNTFQPVFTTHPSSPGVLVCVDVVDVQGILHQIPGLWLHPRRHKGRQVQPGAQGARWGSVWAREAAE